MVERLSPDAVRFRDALVGEIKAEMGRKGIRSTRQLAEMIGESSPYLSARLDGGEPKTKRRVLLNVVDLEKIGHALDVEPSELLARATLAAPLNLGASIDLSADEGD